MIINITLDYDLDSNEDPGAVVRAFYEIVMEQSGVKYAKVSIKPEEDAA